MADICETLKQCLDDAPLGTPVSIGSIPDSPDNICVLVQRLTTNIDQYFGMREKLTLPMITLTLRNTHYLEGARLVDIATALLSSMRIGKYDVFETGAWGYIGRDKSQRHIFQVNFKVIVRE